MPDTKKLGDLVSCHQQKHPVFVSTGGRESMYSGVGGPVTVWKHDWFCGQSCLCLILTDLSWSLIDF